MPEFATFPAMTAMPIVSRSDDLEVLLSVAEHGSFSRAAVALNQQVSTISRAVARVEQQLQTTLFNRTTRRVELTEEGRVFLDKVRTGLEHLADAEEWLRTRQETPAGRLRVNAASPFILHQLTRLVAGFHQSYPLINLELQSGEGVIDLLEKRTDVGLRIGQLEDSTLHSRLLGLSRLHLVASSDYLNSRESPESVSDLPSHANLGFTEPTTLNHWPVGEGIDIQPVFSSDNGEVVRQLCLAGNGIACLSNFMVHEDINCGDLVTILSDQMQTPHPREQVQAVYYRNTTLSSRISCFLDYITDKLLL